MIKFCFCLQSRQVLKFSDPGKSLLLPLLQRSLCKYSTVNNLGHVDWQQIGHLLRAPARNFRYLPWSASHVYFQTQRRQAGSSSLRWQSKMAASKPACSRETELKDDFENTFHFIVDELIQQEYENDEVKQAVSWVQQVMEYNIQGGKKARGLALVVTFNNLYMDTNSALLDKAFILGWCVEMLQAFFLISDDIVDQSQTRRGKACWYRKVGFGAVNDVILLETVIYKILKDHFGGLPCYSQILEEFRETTWKTALGQCLDLKSSPEGHTNWNLFTQERYEAIVQNKTTYYTFCLPIHLAIILGESDLSRYKDLDEILMKMGYYFQVQDDYLDSFGDPDITGKYGSDIEDGKCTWVILEALKVADDKTKKILKDNYGKNVSHHSSVVKDIYHGLRIPQRYKEFEDEIYLEILSMIHTIQPVHPKCVPVLMSILEKLHLRNK